MDVTMKLRATCGHDSRSVDGCTNCEAADEIEALRLNAARDSKRLDFAAVNGLLPLDSKTGAPGGNGLRAVAADRASIDAGLALCPHQHAVDQGVRPQPTNAEDAAEGNVNAIRHIAYSEGYADGVAAERERIRVLVEAVRDANRDAEDVDTYRLLKPGQERAWLALLAGLKGPNGSVEPGTTVRRCDSARTRG